MGLDYSQARRASPGGCFTCVERQRRPRRTLPTAIMTGVLLDAECKGIINASQRKVLLQQIALQLSWF
ncbi:hypothetical protein CUMW_110130 [Citrus unshiu]|nr:hypothetical protein CUMW_110130 [Citrus unshiu]